MTCCFAIIPDGASAPAALFESLEDAMEWAVMKYGGDKFSIKHVAAADVSGAEDGAPANPSAN
jgi:hypothetical protein